MEEKTLWMTSAHVHSLLLHCSLVHSLLLLHSLLSALELPYEVHRTNPVKGHNAVMHWCTDALMMHSLTLLWCVVNLWFHRSAILYIMKEFRDLRDFHHFWRLWPAATVTYFIFLKDYDHCRILWPVVVWLISEFATARSIFRSAAPHNLLWQVS